MAGIGAAVSVAGPAIGAGVQAGMAGKAADASRKAAQRALEYQKAGAINATNELNTSTRNANALLDPYSQMGTRAAGALSNGLYGSPQSVFRQSFSLQPYPTRSQFKSNRAFQDAKKAWNASYDNTRAEAAKVGINMPDRATFNNSVQVSDGKGGTTWQSSVGVNRLNQYISNFNNQEAAAARNRQNLAGQGINADNYTGAMMDKGDMTGAGMLSHAYTLDDYKRQFGEGAKAPWQTTLADFKTSPDYEWRLSQGQKGIESSAAAKGGLLSSATMKALGDYNQNQAAGEYQNWWNRTTSNYQNWFNNYQNQAQNRRADQSQFANTNQLALNSGQQAATGQSNNIANKGMLTANIESNVGNMNASNALAQGAIQSNQYQGYTQAANTLGSGIAKAAGQYFSPGATDTTGGSTSSNGLSLPAYTGGQSNTTGVGLANAADNSQWALPQSLRTPIR